MASRADGRLSGRVAVVTGVGTGGIGWTTAKLFASEGASVVVADYDDEAGKSCADVITVAGGSAKYQHTDVREPDEMKRLMEMAIDEFGKLDCLFNNVADQRGAMSGTDTNVIDTPIEIWDHTMSVNLRSVFLACKFAIPLMIEGGGGSIVNNSSISAFVGELGNVAYGASKAGVTNLTRYVAAAHGRQGIRCNAVAPALVAREPGSRPDGDPVQRMESEEFVRVQAAQSLTGNIGTTQDVGELVLFLCSDEAKHITGQTIMVDGGLLNGRTTSKLHVATGESA